MKVNEIIINEGPVWQGIKSKLGGGTYSSGYNVAKGQQEIAKMAKQVEPFWYKVQAGYQQQGVDPTAMADHLTNWARKWFQNSSIPSYSDAVKLPTVTGRGVRKYLQIATSYYVAPNSNSIEPPQPYDEESQPQPQAVQTTPRSPEEIRKEKLAAAARVAQAQIAANQKARSKQQPQAQPQAVQTTPRSPAKLAAPTQPQAVQALSAPSTRNLAMVPNTTTMSNTGGTVTKTNTGVRHISSPNNPNRIANAKPIR